MKNLGFVGFPNHAVTPDGEIFSSKSNRFIKLFQSNVGYYIFTSFDSKRQKTVNFAVHRLVAMCYVDNPDTENNTQVNHKDGNKINNHFSNLEWVTPQYNTQHSNTEGLRKKPFTEDYTKIPDEAQIIHDWKSSGKTFFNWTEEEARNAAQLLESGYRVCDVSAMTGLCRRGIQYLRDGEKMWGYLTKEYDFSKVKRKNKLSVEKIVDICKRLESGQSCRKIYLEMGIERKVVEAIAARKTHTEVSKDFKF